MDAVIGLNASLSLHHVSLSIHKSTVNKWALRFTQAKQHVIVAGVEKINS